MSIQDIRTQFRDHFRWIAYAIALVFIIGAVWQFGAAPERQSTPDAEKVIALVGKTPITQDEFDTIWAQVSENASQFGVTSTLGLANYRQQVFLQLVQSKKLVILAEKEGIKITDKDIDKKLDEKIVAQLKANRKAVLGNISEEQEKIDPRKDKAYLAELKANGMSVAIIEDQVARMNTREMIKAEIAGTKFSDIIKSKTDALTDADIENSYTTYKIREIALSKTTADEQIKAKAGKIYTEAKGGADFAKLAKENSTDAMKSQGGAFDLNFDSQHILGTEVYDAVKKLEIGGISPVIETDRGYYIVKLEKKEKKLPEKFDKKAKDERKKQISSMLEYRESMKIQKELMSTSDVTVKNKEMEGYWRLFLSQSAASLSSEEQEKEASLALAAFETAYKEDPSNDYAAVMYVISLNDAGKKDEAGKLLYTLLEGETSMVQGADLNMMLADYLLSKGDSSSKEEAIKQYQKASEAAINDLQVHTELKLKFTQLGKLDLAAKESAWIDSYNKQMEEERQAREEAEKRAKEAEKRNKK